MCGIAGFLTRQGAPAEAGTWATRMTRTLAHRGPDYESTWCDLNAGIALGHRRLAVVDLSSAGNQPMTSTSGRYVIVFNGEIYNFLDLRKDLERIGPRFHDLAAKFHGHSDTEVMLACFEQWGVIDSVARFNGMFAFAVWDRLERNLHLARDPVGEKPLYYARTPNGILFGSELKSLRVHPDFRGDIDRAALAFYLERGYVPAPYSIYKNIFKLKPGTILTIPSSSRREIVTRYWSFKDAAERGCANPVDLPDEEASQCLERLLADATRIRMVADVPLGAFLSGGIDSSVVVALMQSLSSQPVRTFTIGFHESSYNEAAAAKAVAKHLRTDHTEWYITPRDALDVVPRLPTLYDEPFADSSQIPTYLVSKLAREHVTVSLSGDGGDELFGGYRRYSSTARQWQMLSSAPAPMRSLLAKSLRPVTHDDLGRLGSRVLALLPRALNRYRLRKLAALAESADREVFYEISQRQWWGSPVIASEPIDRLIEGELPHCSDFLQHMMAVDTLTYLPDDILVKVDRAAMAVSLESRIPLLDSRVIEFAWSLPTRMKLQNQTTRSQTGKWILRSILRRYLPEALFERPKSGFAVPVAQWLRGPLRDWAEDLLDSRSIDREGYLASEAIRRRWREHLTGVEDHSGALWSVLMFQAWLRTLRLPCEVDGPTHPFLVAAR
jgi:asparagine synthase (glutamine-hydrolysing)